ncbi:hypothetical protein [Rhizobium leguminosarum]|uniref:Uncharacterized protein n=1 Tax=Rhizobium leguminosarum TaxID=384 RepID=A0A2K9ZGP3_RHILE|nr:hypothetical protein [Rhizobium leguminosarum]AUW47389.1 hypothetical protein CUJ84_pRLN3000262 [Rhizobium leguminosarum]
MRRKACNSRPQPILGLYGTPRATIGSRGVDAKAKPPPSDQDDPAKIGRLTCLNDHEQTSR